MIKKIFLSVVIPLYNEEQRINKTFQELESYFKDKKYSFEVIFVNDGSTDKTKEIIEKYCQNHSNYQLLDFTQNHGKGFAVRQGMLKAQGEHILFTDADFSTPLNQLDKLMTYIQDHQIVIGSRYLESDSVKIKQPLIRRLISRAGNLVMKLIIGLLYQDTQCGFKLFQNQAAKKIFSKTTINRWGFDMEILTIAKVQNFKVKEVAVDWFDNQLSKLRAGRAVWNTFNELMKIKLNELSSRYK